MPHRKTGTYRLGDIKVGYEKRVRMSREERAKQFLPFSAVRGLEEALERKRQELFVEVPHVLCSDAEEEINDTLNNITKGDTVEIEFYDGVKNTLITGNVESVRNKTRDIVIDGKVIRFEVIGKLKLVEKKRVDIICLIFLFIKKNT